MKHAGSGIVVPVTEHIAFAGIAVANTSVCGVPLSTVREGHAHQVVTDWIDEYCYTSHAYSEPEWAWLDVTIHGGHALHTYSGQTSFNDSLLGGTPGAFRAARRARAARRLKV